MISPNRDFNPSTVSLRGKELMPVVKSAPNRFLAASTSSNGSGRTDGAEVIRPSPAARLNAFHAAHFSGFPGFSPKASANKLIDATGKPDHLTLADGRRTSSYGIEQLVEFRSRHSFSRFGDIQISSSKGEFDEISNFRSDQNRRFLTRRGERNWDRSPFDSRQQLERNPHQKLVGEEPF